jgi:Na+-translocating ferredoxin:NAD+ oxidoreductase RnfD subunit
MTALAAQSPQYVRHVRRFVRTPKGIVLLILASIAGVALAREGAELTLPGILAAVGAAAALDLVWLRWLKGRWLFPSGAIITGLIVAMVLSPHEPLVVPFMASAIAIAGKRTVRLARVNVFNPSALGLVLSAIVFGSGQSWWGALPGFGTPGLFVVAASGVFVADRINKLPAVLAFVGVYFLVFTASSLLGDPADYADVFRRPDLHAALFFALFMLDDPPTCPVRYSDQFQFGAVIAAVSYLAFTMLGAIYFLPAGLLAGNLHEALRRQLSARKRRRTRAG